MEKSLFGQPWREVVPLDVASEVSLLERTGVFRMPTVANTAPVDSLPSAIDGIVTSISKPAIKLPPPPRNKGKSTDSRPVKLNSPSWTLAPVEEAGVITGGSPEASDARRGADKPPRRGAKRAESAAAESDGGGAPSEGVGEGEGARKGMAR